MASDQNELGRYDLGAPGSMPDYRLDQVDPDPDLSANAAYGEQPDALPGVSSGDDGRALEEDTEEDAGAEPETTTAPRLPVNQLPVDDALHRGRGSRTVEDDVPNDSDNAEEPDGHGNQAKSETNGREGTVIDVVFEAPNPPSRERVELERARARVYDVARGETLPSSVKSKLLIPADAATVAVATKVAVSKMEARERAAQAEATADTAETSDAALLRKGREDPAHLRSEMHQSGPGRFVDALAQVNVERDIMTPMTEPKGFAKKLEEADPDAFLAQVRDRTTMQFFLGEAADASKQPAEDSDKPEYIGLLYDPAIVGKTAKDGRSIMGAESKRLHNLMHLHSGMDRPSDPEGDITAVRNYIDMLNVNEAKWMNYHGRGNPGDPTQTVSPHHAARLEWFLSFARPLVEEQGEFAADSFTAGIVREMAEARIESRRQDQYQAGPEAYRAGQRVGRLSDADLEDLALATRFEERVARHEQVPDAKAAEVVMKGWDDVIMREDRLYQAALRQQRPELFKPGVAPPVSPRHLIERFEQVGYKFRMRLGGQLEGPEPSLHGRASANAGLITDMEEYMAERARVRHELRLATHANPAKFLAGDRPGELSQEEIDDWARLTALKIDIAIQPEFQDVEGGTADQVLVDELAKIIQRDTSLGHAARHRQDPSRLYRGQLPDLTPQEIRGMIELAAMTAKVRIQGGGMQAGHEYIAEVTRDLQRLIDGRMRYAEQGGDLSKILGGNLSSEHLHGLPKDTIAVLRDAAAAKVEEQIANRIQPDPIDLERLAILQGEMDAIDYDRTGHIESLRTSAALTSAQQAMGAKNKTEHSVHITAGPGPETPDLLVSLLAGFGVFDQISIDGTRTVHDTLRIAAGKEISPVANRDLVVATPGYRSAETLIIQGRAPASVDPYAMLKDPTVQRIIIQDIPQNAAVVNEMLQLIDDGDPRAPFQGQFTVDATRTGWADIATLELDMDEEDNGRVTVLFTRNRAA